MDTYSLEEECWEYLDPKSKKQGPFSGSRMLVWYEHNMLPEDLQVRHGPAMPYVPIRELFHPPLLPFRSRPRPGALPAPAGKCHAQWQYIDSKGQLQGPFSSTQMAQWHEHNMLPASLQLRRTTDSAFGTIANYFPSPLVPFQSLPATPSQPSSGKAAPIGAPALDGKALLKQLQKPQQAQHAAQPGPPPAQPVAQQPQPKGKAAAKGKAATRNDGNARAAAEATEVGEVGAGKGAGRGEGKGGPAAKAGRGRQAKDGQPASWAWSEQGWAAGADKAWWEWNAWNEWAGDDGWEHNGRDRPPGSEWKGAENHGGQPKEKGEKGATAVQAAFGNLRWGPRAEVTDLFPESLARKVLDEGIVWEERWISPLSVRFSQGKIHPFFHERGPISEVMLQIRLREDPEGPAGNAVRRVEPPFPPVRLLHLKEQGVLVTLDNRRLYALQRFALQEWPCVCLVRALCVDELTPTRLRAENRKFTNRLCGLQLEVESRSNAFDTFSWVTEAAHVEAPRFIRPISLRAGDRAVSLLPALVVHALVCPGLRPLLRSRWPLLCYLATVLPNPRRREFPTKRLLLHHVLELARPTRKVRPCPAFCLGYTAETVVTLSKGRSCVTSKLSVAKPLTLLQADHPLSHLQQQALGALLPMFCLPYARSELRGSTQDWAIAFLLAWAKVAASGLRLPELR